MTKPDEVVEIPLLKSLEQMLNDPAILNEVLLPLQKQFSGIRFENRLSVYLVNFQIGTTLCGRMYSAYYDNLISLGIF